jgi:hypothetical protein
LSFTAQLGQAKIALALLLRVIFFKNHSRRVYMKQRGERGLGLENEAKTADGESLPRLSR